VHAKICQSSASTPCKPLDITRDVVEQPHEVEAVADQRTGLHVFPECRNRRNAMLEQCLRAGALPWPSEFAIDSAVHCTGAGSICEILEGLAVCESPWRRRTPGALCCRSGFPPIPAAVLTGRKYSKGSPLTVSFRPRFKLFAQNRSEGRSVLRWYPPGVKLIVHNSASVPIQPETQFYAGHNSVARTAS
jgi:hypothetical protein